MDAFSLFGSGSGGSSFAPPAPSVAPAPNLTGALQAISRENSAFSQANAERQMAFQAEQNRIARDWQEKMSNTAYQRAVADLKAAGLNPILAAHNGASTPSASGASGAMGQVDNSVIGALASVAVASINSAATMANADKSFMSSVISSLMSNDAVKYSADRSADTSINNSVFGTANKALKSTLNYLSSLDWSLNNNKSYIKPQKQKSYNDIFQ